MCCSLPTIIMQILLRMSFFFCLTTRLCYVTTNKPFSVQLSLHLSISFHERTNDGIFHFNLNAMQTLSAGKVLLQFQSKYVHQILIEYSLTMETILISSHLFREVGYYVPRQNSNKTTLFISKRSKPEWIGIQTGLDGNGARSTAQQRMGKVYSRPKEVMR